MIKDIKPLVSENLTKKYKEEEPLKIIKSTCFRDPRFKNIKQMTDESDRQNLIQETIKLNEKLQASKTESQSQLPSTENQDLESISNRWCLPMATSIPNTSNNKTKPYSSYVKKIRR